VPLFVTGGLFLWFAWIFFNASSDRFIHDPSYNNDFVHANMNTFISPCSAGVTTFLVASAFRISNDRYDPCLIVNSALIGLVVITP